jgi:PKD repeat protein
MDRTNLYAGGNFEWLAGRVNFVAKWDGAAWSELGAGLDAWVNALAWDGTNLYAGGLFATAGSVTANRVAKWDGTTWSALGTGMDADVDSLAWCGTNLYAGGYFHTAGDIAAWGLAKWNGTAWSALGTYNYGPAFALAWDRSNLFAGIGPGGGVSFIERWDGTDWYPLGRGTDSEVYALAWTGTRLYAGGLFTTAGGVGSVHIARWSPPASIAYQPSSQVILCGQSTVLNVGAAGAPPLVYQWYQGPSGTITTPVGTNASTFNTPALTDTTSYWVRVSNGCGTSADSASATVTVGSLSCTASAPSLGTVGLTVAFAGSGTLAGGCTQAVNYNWDFGDGSDHSTLQNPSHTYATAGTKTWTLTVMAGNSSCERTGTITLVNGPVIGAISKLGSPFRIKVVGSNLQSGIQVFINGTPWNDVKWKKDTLLKLMGGSGLKTVVPKGVPTTFHFVNPDGGEAFETWQW